MAHKLVHIPHLGHSVCLVPREQLRFTLHGRRFSPPDHLRGIQTAALPPAIFNWSKGNLLQYPMLGNDTKGDCWYAAMCHAVQTWTGNAGVEAVFSAAQVLARYAVLSRGDNGLSDAQIIPEWKAGIVGPNGPYKILDEMTVNPTDSVAVAMAMFYFCGLCYTAALLDQWVANPRPGDTWDAVGRADPNNGHAMFLTGHNASGGYDDETWAFDPPINLTPAGMLASDPELIVAFSLSMFNSAGLTPAGQTYDQAAALWVQCGGQQLPPSPFGPPAPPVPVPPVPVPPAPPVPTPPAPGVLTTGTYTVPVGAKLIVL